jgi:hypothetical protein
MMKSVKFKTKALTTKHELADDPHHLRGALFGHDGAVRDARIGPASRNNVLDLKLEFEDGKLTLTTSIDDSPDASKPSDDGTYISHKYDAGGKLICVESVIDGVVVLTEYPSDDHAYDRA